MSEATEQRPKECPEVVTGIAASPGRGTGRVRRVLEMTDLHEIGSGDVVVARFTTPFFTPFVLEVAAIVTDVGGITSHAASIAREMGVPAVVGTRIGTKCLFDGQIVTVDGTRGVVYYV